MCPITSGAKRTQQSNMVVVVRWSAVIDGITNFYQKILKAAMFKLTNVSAHARTHDKMICHDFKQAYSSSKTLQWIKNILERRRGKISNKDQINEIHVFHIYSGYLCLLLIFVWIYMSQSVFLEYEKWSNWSFLRSWIRSSGLHLSPKAPIKKLCCAG